MQMRQQVLPAEQPRRGEMMVSEEADLVVSFHTVRSKQGAR